MSSKSMGNKSENVVESVIIDKGIINYSFFTEYYQWMFDNEKDLRNLNNGSYWRSKMTPEEIEMRSHPNRSHHWIPNRLEKIKKELADYQLDAQLGKNGWDRLMFGKNANCMRCGIAVKGLQNYQKDLIQNIKEMANEKWPSNDEYQKLLEQAIIKINPNYTEEEIKKSVIIHPDNGSHSIVSLQRGFCPDCYERFIHPLLGWDSRLDNYK